MSDEFDEFGDFGDLDALIDGEVELEKTSILLVTSLETYSAFASCVPKDSSYNLIHSLEPKEAISHLLQEQIVITFIEHNYLDDIIEFSASIHHYVPLSRIILITDRLSTDSLSEITNIGAINAILPTPFNQTKVMEVLSQQDAKHSINKMLVQMITEPPKLSKASFLLLDPSLQFGSEDVPLNFVGLMCVSNTVPKYTRFFEETLAQDPMLFAGYLSGITSLGNSLFSSDQALKEINFGGISVIFQFHNQLQIFFFVRNLTRENYEKAEGRVSAFSKQIVDNFYKDFVDKPFISEILLDEIDKLADEFDLQDDVEMAQYQDKMVEQIDTEGDTNIVIYSNNEGDKIKTRLLDEFQKNPYENKINLDVIHEEELFIAHVETKKHHVLILDSDSDTGGRSGADFTDFIKETSPSLQLIYLERNDNFSDSLIDSFNSETINFILPFDMKEGLLNKTVVEADTNVRRIRFQSGSKPSDAAGNMEAMKILLREEQDAYNIEEQPELVGIIIAEDMKPVFDHFWETNQNYDTEMIAGMLLSLENIGGEMFFEKEDIQLLELGGYNVFVRNVGQYMFSFFVKHNNPTTTVIINKEIEAVVSIYTELIREAAGVISYKQLEPIFAKLANETRGNFTDLYRESQRNKQQE
ncbi:MAG: hypothetical protein INQ03_15335 [Candidatus Heimdallarchaeota archaeon]|nr:hypothetical protein [Candidatus Heimdallarchaeota archaeon]